MTDHYITSEDLKKSVELTGTTFADRDIERAIPAASRAVDRICGRRFWLDEEAVARRYSAGRTSCVIDDLPRLASAELEDLATVEIDTAGDGSFATAWVYGTDYDFEPLNAEADGRPFTHLVSLDGTFPSRRAAVRVTAQFGWEVVPDEVVEATLLLANRLLVRTRQAPLGAVVAGIDVGVAMRISRSDPDVMGLLEGVTRIPALRSVALS